MPGWQRNIVHTFLGGCAAMTDPRPRTAHPAHAGLLGRRVHCRRTPHAVVVGGGIAGLAAATGLAERGVGRRRRRTRGLPRRPRRRLDRATSEGGADLAMNRGFHAFFRQYYNLRELLRRVDPALGDAAPRSRTTRSSTAQGRRDTFRGLPADAAAERAWRSRCAARRSGCATWPGSTRAPPRRWRRFGAGHLPPAGHIDADTFPAEHQLSLMRHGISRSRCSPAAFSPSPTDLSAAELATMFHIYFLGSSEGLIFDVANANFDTALWKPLREYLESRGVQVPHGRRRHRRRAPSRTTSRAHAIRRRPRRRRRGAGHRHGRAAAHRRRVAGARRRHLAGAGRGDCAPRRRSSCSGCGSTGRSTPTGRRSSAPAAMQPLDNISVLERYEREAAEWARAHRRLGRRTAFLCRAIRPTRPRRPDAGPVARALSGDRQSARIVDEQMLITQRLPPFRARRPRRTAQA